MLDGLLLLTDILKSRQDIFSKSSRHLYLLTAIRYLNDKNFNASAVTIFLFTRKAYRTITPQHVRELGGKLAQDKYLRIEGKGTYKITTAGRQVLNDIEYSINNAAYKYTQRKKPITEAPSAHPRPMF